MQLSAIVICRNEAAHLERCLRSLHWVEEVVVADSGSTDGTLEIAAGFANVKLVLTPWLGYSETKRVAVRQARHSWILWVDADEAVTDKLQQEINRLTEEQLTTTAAWEMPRRTFFLGTWVRHTGWYPGYVVRLFDRRRCDFNDHILHEGVSVDSPHVTGRLAADLLHYSYNSLYQYFDKMNRYGRLGAEELHRKGRKVGPFTLVLNPLFTFLKFYFFKKGFRDGTTGLIISIGSAFSNFIKYTNYFYLLREQPSNRQRS